MDHVTRSSTTQSSRLEVLMEGYLAGDAAAFNALYAFAAPEVRAYARRRTRNKEDVEDVVQTTFAKLHRARSRYRVGMPVMPWIMTIARHSVYDRWRQESRRREYAASDTVLSQAANDGLHGYAEQLDALAHALAQLPATQREAFELARLDELSGEEAARQLETTRTAVKLRVHRAHHALERLLAA